MSNVVDYFFSLNSPWTYLGHARFREILSRHGAQPNLRPVDFGRVFPASGGLPLAKRPPQRQAYRLVELRRWRNFLDVPLNIQPKHFPVSPDLAALDVIAADAIHGPTRAMDLAGAILRAVWAEEKNIADRATLHAITTAQGFDADSLAERAAAPETKAAYDAFTQAAIDRQVFGAPTYVYRDEPFWGQDRLDFLDRALSR